MLVTSVDEVLEVMDEVVEVPDEILGVPDEVAVVLELEAREAHGFA